MAHFAQIDEDGVVIQVIVVADDECLDQAGNEHELLGATFCHRLLGGRWVQTSYNGRIRKRFAGVGFRYDPTLDEFLPPESTDQA
jgi:hypothetical protein